MVKRIITGAVYVLVFVGLIALKWLVPEWGALGFDVLFTVISVLASIELLNAFKTVSFPQKVITIAFCSLVVPLYTLIEMTSRLGFLAVACVMAVYVIALFVFYFAKIGGSDLKSTLLSLLTIVYCGFLCCILSAVNHIPDNSVAAMLLLFFVVMLTDSGALFVGSFLKRWIPYKLAPSISPNKTVIGGIGGIIGGVGAAVAAFYLYQWLGGLIGTPLVYSGSIPAVVAFILIGLVTSIFDQAGDLFESALKRKCGVKDMGNLLPGHGGILDRFDSLLFSGVIVLISFALILI